MEDGFLFNLQRWRHEFSLMSHVSSVAIDLVFVKRVAADSPAYQLEATPGANITLYPLDIRNGKQVHFIRTQIRFSEMLTSVERCESGNADVQASIDELADGIRRELFCMDILKARAWEQRRQSLVHPDRRIVNTSPYARLVVPQDTTLAAAVMTCLSMNTLFHLPRRGSRMLLAGIRDLLLSLSDSQQARQASQILPVDPRTVINTYAALDAHLTRYICCPSCHDLSLMQLGRDGLPTSKIRCDNMVINGTRCQEHLWEVNEALGSTSLPSQVWTPRKQYADHSLADWLGSLLCHPEVEDILDTYPYGPDPTAEGHGPDAIGDIIFSPLLKHLRTRDGQHAFLQPPHSLPENCGRYVFCLCVDSFNPFHMKTAKQTVSATGIWMICLNFPPHLRIRSENIFLRGTISGKVVEPYLDLLVRELNSFHDPGIWYSETRNYPNGRHVQLLLIPVICDMLALRQVGGFSGVTSSFFCTCCALPYAWIENLDRTTWPSRNVVQHRQIAFQWKQAVSEEARRQLSDDGYGIKWSPLLNLPYMDIIGYSVPDSFHLMAETVHTTLRGFWQIDSTRPGGDGMLRHFPFDHTSTEVQRAKAQLDATTPHDPNAFNWLEQLKLSVLQSLCALLDLRYATNRSRRQLAIRLVYWHLKRHAISAKTYKLSDVELEIDTSKDYPVVRLVSSELPNIDLEDLQNIDVEYDADAEHNSITVEEDYADVENEIPHPTHNDPLITHFTQLRILGYFRAFLTGQPHTLPLSKEEQDFKQLVGLIPSERQAEIHKFVRSLIRLGSGLIKDRAKWDDYRRDVYVAVTQGCDLSWDQKKTKEWLHTQLRAWIGRELKALPLSEDVIKASNSRFKFPRHILGSDLLREIWIDMGKTQLPSYASSAPVGWGTAGRGKLKLNDWLSLGKVHLPITLIRLWGCLPPNDRKRKLLDNFMKLNNLLRIGSLRYTTPVLAEKFSKIAREFIYGLLSLFPDVTMKPMQHVLLHSETFMKAFGPQYSYSVAAFERYVHFQQEQNTNMKIGQLETTMTTSSIRSANFRAFIRSNAMARALCPNLFGAFDECLSESGRSGASSDPSKTIIIGPPTSTHTLADPGQISSFLKQTPALSPLFVDDPPSYLEIASVDQCFLRGVRYACRQKNIADSCVIIDSSTDNPWAGDITLITLFQFKHALDDALKSVIFFDVEPYELVRFSSLDGQAKDLDAAYRRYGVSGGFLCTFTKQSSIHVSAEKTVNASKCTLLLSERTKLLHFAAMAGA